MRSRPCVALPWFGWAWLLALPAFAQPRLEWQSSAGCPDGDDGQAQVERLLHAQLSELAIQLSAAVRLRRESGSAFTATIDVQQDGVTRSRVLHSDDCAVLAHASEMIVALAIDPTARVEEPSTAVSPEAEQQDASAASPPPSAAVAASETRPAAGGSPDDRSTRAEIETQSAGPSADGPPPPAADGGRAPALHGFVGGGFALDAGTLPRLAPVLALMAGLDSSWARAALRLMYAPAQRGTAATHPGLAGQVGLTAAALEAGPHWRFARLELSSLAGFEAGVFEARGSEGVSDQETKRPLWLGAYLGGGIALLPTANFKIGLRLDGILALRRPSFVLRSDMGDNLTVHRPHFVSGRGWLEVELHFPR